MKRQLCAALLALGLASCGGGGGGTAAVPSAPGAGSAGSQRVAISLIVPANGSSTNGARRPAYISASALGAGIVVTQGSATVNAVLDLSAASGACQGSSGSRTCTTNVTVPIGTDAFTISIYNESPSGSSIPSGAKLLGIGTTTVDVIANQTTNIPVFIGGEVAGFGSTLPSGSVPANGTPQSVALVIAPTDFGDNPIVAGQNDPYANPITVAVTESGGTGHAGISLNGGAETNSVVLTQSNATLDILYDGGGSLGYSFTISLSASGVNTQSSIITPLIASVGGSTVTSLALSGSSSSITLTVGEAGTTRTYTPAASGCSGIATIGSLSGSGADATLPLQGGATASASGCSLSITDSLSTVLTLPITNTTIAGTTTINGTQINEYGGYGNPYGITTGPDGNIWFSDQDESTVFAFSPSTDAQVNAYPLSGEDLYDLTTGSDGAVWVTDQENGGADRITPAGIITQYPYSGLPQGIISGADSTLWIAENASGDIWNLSLGGGFTAEPIDPSGSPSELTQTPDGNIWFAETGYIGTYNPTTQTLNETTVPGGDNANYITTGPDGAVWFTASGSPSYIGRIDPTSGPPYTVTQPEVLAGGSIPEGITAGADQAVWFVDQGLNDVGRISTQSGYASSAFALPTSGAGPLEITLGPDGSLWFTENAVGQIGHLIP